MMVIEDRKVIGVDYGTDDGDRTVISRYTNVSHEFVLWTDRINAFPITTLGNQTHIYMPLVGDLHQPQTKAEKNQARLKQLRGRAGRWA